MNTKIAIVIPTCDSDRKPFLDFLMTRIKMQTRAPDHVIVVNYPNKGVIDITERFKKGMDKAFGLGCELVMCMEDDDYYPVTYVEHMERAWVENGKPVIIGHTQKINYNIKTSKYHIVNRTTRSSAFCTAVSRGVNFDIKEQVWDYEAWAINKGKLVYISPPAVGIKHGIGMTGGHVQSICLMPDPDHKMLKKMVDNHAYKFYEKIRDHKYDHCKV